MEALDQLILILIQIFVLGFIFACVLRQQRAFLRFWGKLPVHLIRLLFGTLRIAILFVVNTITLTFRTIFHIGDRGALANDAARWVERMTDAVLRRRHD